MDRTTPLGAAPRHRRFVAVLGLGLVLGLVASCSSSPTEVTDPVEAAVPVVVFDMLHQETRAIFRVGLDGSDLRALSGPEASDMSPSASAGTVIFSRYLDGNAELHSVPLEGGAPLRLTATPGHKTAPALSPSGTLAFEHSGTAGRKVYISDTLVASPVRATPTLGTGASVELSPTWSPDGNQLAFVSTHEGNANIYVLEVATGSLTPVLVGAPAYIQPAWSPDGHWLAYASNQDGSTDLYRIHLGTGDRERLTDRPESDARPAWTADGRLVFVRYEDESTHLHWMDPDHPSQTHRIPLPEGGQPMNPASPR